MTKSDDFFDITGASALEPGTQASARSVDFDVFGGAEPPSSPATDVTSEFTETLVASSAKVMAERNLDVDLGGDAPAPAPIPMAPAPAKDTAPPAAPAPAGGIRRWLIGVVLAAIAAAVWWLLK